MEGENRRYRCEPYTAEETSKPDPTLPWARQWASWAREWTRSSEREGVGTGCGVAVAVAVVVVIGVDAGFRSMRER
jgi:hypothetical protein